ncbi:reverse transcriptase domain-containing protein [Tanacetum coccineum]
MPNNVKTYDGTGAARVWFDELLSKSIDGYKDLKAAFLAYFMQQKKYVKDPVEIHNIKQRDGETIEEFMKRFKVETGRMKGALECMRISGFMHGVNNPQLTKRLNEHVPNTKEEMMITTTAFIQGEDAAAGKKKGHASWRAQDQSERHASKRRSDFRAIKHDRSTAINSGTSTQYPGRIFTHLTEKKRPGLGAYEIHPSGVMVKKHDGSWRMCVDFTDLNKACPQDYYPLLKIDWKVESLYGYLFKCFLDAYKGYHQIYMAESDEEKTAFHTSQGVYCYTKMPFGLKNASAAYQQLVDKAFDS